MKILCAYLKKHRWGIFGIGFSLMIFALMFILYGLPKEPLIYGSVLVFVGVFVVGGVGFWNYSQKHALLLRLRACEESHNLTLPEAEELIEADYQEIIAQRENELRRLISKKDKDYKEMVEYYTLWAHQIKTPISALYLMIEREGREQDRPLAQQLFFVEQYVEMALHYLRSDSISADLDLAEYSIDKIIREVIKKHSRQFIYKKIQLNFQDSGELVLTDEKWLAFVLEQLISNSLKYTKEGSISIYMEENKTLVIEDTGIGIREEDLPRICEKGFTGFNGRMDKKSTGIGLYLCKKILTKLSHTIEFESVSCKGTKVKIGLSTHAPIRE